MNGGNPEGSARLAYAQMTLHALYAYAVPSPETLEWVMEFCAGQRVVELGAGRGYWAAQLARMGMAVAAYDQEPPHAVDNASLPRGGEQAAVWHPVSGLGELDTNRSDHVLSCAGRRAGATRWPRKR